MAWYTCTSAQAGRAGGDDGTPHESVEDDESAPNVIILEGDEAREFFDAQARELIGMSGPEFLRRLDSGEWDEVIDDPEYADHLFLAMTRSFGE